MKHWKSGISDPNPTKKTRLCKEGKASTGDICNQPIEMQDLSRILDFERCGDLQRDKVSS